MKVVHVHVIVHGRHGNQGFYIGVREARAQNFRCHTHFYDHAHQ